MIKRQKKKNLLIINSLFVIFSAAILIFLFNAPESTTSPLPRDEDHNQFYEIKSKKDAEKYCANCHDQDKQAPLPEDHPPKFRCLFCHKLQ